MTATYFKATHSTGTVHLRSTNGNGAYKFAVVGPRAASSASFSSRRELAAREAEKQLQYRSDIEVVPAVEIERAEYNDLLKASSLKYLVTFRGKKFTKSVKLGARAITHAVGVYRAEKEERVELNAEMHPSWLERYPEGFYIRQDREIFSVEWFSSEDFALKSLKQNLERGWEAELFTL